MINKVTLASRLALGFIFVVFGLNGFFNFLPAPTGLPEAAGAFLGGLAQSGYFFPFLKGTEVLVGLLLLSGVAAPLALVVLAPISINIFLFHAILTPGIQNSILPIAIIALHVTAAVAYWPVYKPLFQFGRKEQVVTGQARTAVISHSA